MKKVMALMDVHGIEKPALPKNVNGNVADDTSPKRTPDKNTRKQEITITTNDVEWF